MRLLLSNFQRQKTILILNDIYDLYVFSTFHFIHFIVQFLATLVRDFVFLSARAWIAQIFQFMS